MPAGFLRRATSVALVLGSLAGVASAQVRDPEEAIDRGEEVAEGKVDTWLGQGAVDWLFEPFDEVRARGEERGLSVLGIYSLVFHVADSGTNTMHQGFDLFVYWEDLVETGSWLGRGSVNFYFQHRKDDLLSDDTGEFMRAEGLVQPPNDAFVEGDLNSLNTLAWEQDLFDDRLVLAIGQIDPLTYLDTSIFAGFDRESFLHQTLAANPVSAFPAASLGLGGAVHATKWLGARYLFMDANGEGEYPEFGNLAEPGWAHLGEVFAHGNVAGLGEGNYRVGVQRLVDSQAVETSSTSVSLSFDQEIGPAFGAALRFAHGDGRATEIDSFVSAAAVWRQAFGKNNDWLGLGLFWSDPSPAGLDAEFGGELFWRLQMTERLQVTPDLQVVRPAAGGSAVAIFSLRLGLYL